ncbi:MAG: Mur ligase domain-containing protein, partial [Pseudomonadota bacterium]
MNSFDACNLNVNFNKPHFIGIGGIGMSALAKILLDRGYQVSGSDVSDIKANSNLQRLNSAGAKLYKGHQSQQINKA